MIDLDLLKALLAALSKGECQNNRDQPEHWSQHLDTVLEIGLQLPVFTCTIFYIDMP
jgi:hypothetical protein